MAESNNKIDDTWVSNDIVQNLWNFKWIYSRSASDISYLGVADRLKLFISLYWKSFIVVLAPILLLPVTLVNKEPVSSVVMIFLMNIIQTRHFNLYFYSFQWILKWLQPYRCMYVVLLMAIYWCSEALPLRTYTEIQFLLPNKRFIIRTFCVYIWTDSNRHNKWMKIVYKIYLIMVYFQRWHRCSPLFSSHWWALWWVEYHPIDHSCDWQ